VCTFSIHAFVDGFFIQVIALLGGTRAACGGITEVFRARIPIVAELLGEHALAIHWIVGTTGKKGLVVADTGLAQVIGGLTLHGDIGTCSRLVCPIFGGWWCIGVAIIEGARIVVGAFAAAVARCRRWTSHQVGFVGTAIGIGIADVDGTGITVVTLARYIVIANA
jgi:hypothetical protein